MNYPVHSNIPSLQYKYYMQSSPSDTNSFALSLLYNNIHTKYTRCTCCSSCTRRYMYIRVIYMLFSLLSYIAGPYTYSFSSNVSLTSLDISLFPCPSYFFSHSPSHSIYLSLSLSIYRTRWFCLYRRTRSNTGSSSTAAIASGTRLIIII